MVAAADEAGVTLMVGYPKRYDLAYARFASEVGRACRGQAAPGDDDGVADPALHRALLAAAVRPARRRRGRPRCSPRPRPASTPRSARSSDLERRVYAGVLLDTLVHEINAVRGLLGEPDRLDYVDLSEQNVTVMLRFGELRVADPLGRPARHRQVPDGVRAVRAAPADHAGVSLALPAQRAGQPRRRRRRPRHRPVVAQRRGDRLRERLPARARGIPLLRDDRRGPGRPPATTASPTSRCASRSSPATA